MPYKVEKGHGCPESKPWACINETTGKVHGCHESREKGLKQAAALYANTEEKGLMTDTAPDGELRAALPDHDVAFLNNMLNYHTSLVAHANDHVAAYSDTALTDLATE